MDRPLLSERRNHEADTSFLNNKLHKEGDSSSGHSFANNTKRNGHSDWNGFNSNIKRNRSNGSINGISNTFPRYKNRTQQQQLHITQRFVPTLGFDLRGGGGGKNSAHKSLSLHESCSKCLPESRGDYINKEYSGAGLRDLLTVERGSVRGILSWFAPLLSWTILQLRIIQPLVNPKKLALNSARVQTAIEESAKLSLSGTTNYSPSKPENSQKVVVPSSIEVAIKQQKVKAWSILNTMSSPIYGPFVKLANYTLLWILSRLFRHFYVQRSHVQMLYSAQEKNIPIVFLPCHKSHIDYLILSIALVSLEIKMPHIAAGDNLNIPLFGSFIRHLGGYFIRRKLDLGNSRDVLYRECLQEYVEQLLKANQNMEIFIEGSRSRSGKPSLPKSGLVSFLVEAVREGTVSDILLVPVGIGYDRLVERNFLRHELMGGNKKPENFLKALGGVWRMITSDVGSVRLDFGQPFSLQEYLNSYHISGFSLMNLINPFPSSPNGSRNSLKRSSTDRRIISALSHHLVYDFTQSTTIMSTNIVGFLLLTKYRQGTKVSQLIASYKWMADKVTDNGRALGYSGTPSEAVHYSLHYLSHLITNTPPIVANSNGDIDADRIIRPLLTLPDVFQLSHHANQIIGLFMKEAIIACSLIAMQELERLDKEEEREEIDTQNDDDSIEPVYKPEQVSQEMLIDYALDMTRLIGREFIFAPPCVDVIVALYEGIEELRVAEVFKAQPSSVNQERYGSHNGWNDGDESDEDDQPDVLLELASTQQARGYISFLQSTIAPFIEGYWHVGVKLLNVWEGQQDKKDSPLNENQFLQQLQSTMITKDREGELYCVESCSMDVLRNGLRSFISLEIVTISSEGQLYVIDQVQLVEFLALLAACKV